MAEEALEHREPPRIRSPRPPQPLKPRGADVVVDLAAPLPEDEGHHPPPGDGRRAKREREAAHGDPVLD